VVGCANHSHPNHFAKRRGLTLVELLITLVVITIVAAMLLPQMGQQIPDQLTAVGQIVAADLEYARSLAVVNNSKYSVTFDLADNRYILRHSGANTLLHVLPSSPFRQNDDPPDAQTTDLAELPVARPEVRIVQVASGSSTVTAVSDVEFNSLGGTTRTSLTTVWLACGVGAEARYLPIEVNPVTGLVETGPIAKALPAPVAALPVNN
jgi:prepilin-type N-terminal cleavage/methylation domain-containing protein